MKKSQLTDKPIAPNSYDPMSGTGLGSFLSRVGQTISRTNNFLKNSRAISKVSGVAGDLTGNQSLKNFSSYAAKNGYGRRMPLALQTGMPVVVKRRGRKPGPKKGKKKAKK